MWFKNLTLYRFVKPFEMDIDELESRLSEFQFKPCQANDPSQLGWSSPLGKTSPNLVHVNDKYWMLCLQKQEKILPGSVVKDKVNERAEEIEASEHRKVGRKERNDIKEQITIELMPKAFVRTHKYYAYLCPKDSYMVINTSSAKVADELSAFLRKSIGSLPVRPIAVNHAPSDTMTNWLSGKTNISPAFNIGFECELAETGEEKASVKYKGLDLDIEQIEQHIESGMIVNQVSLNWRENIQFVLSSDLTIKRLKFLELVQEKYDDIETDDAASQFDASFSIMSAEIDNLIPELIEELGGEDRSAVIDNE